MSQGRRPNRCVRFDDVEEQRALSQPYSKAGTFRLWFLCPASDLEGAARRRFAWKPPTRDGDGLEDIRPSIAVSVSPCCHYHR